MRADADQARYVWGVDLAMLNYVFHREISEETILTHRFLNDDNTGVDGVNVCLDGERRLTFDGSFLGFVGLEWYLKHLPVAALFANSSLAENVNALGMSHAIDRMSPALAEEMRHLICRRRGWRLRTLAGPLSPAERVALLRSEGAGLDLAERFRMLHELGIYHDAESLSGTGSSLAETAALRRVLPRVLRERRVRTLLDVPCGDHHWMSRVELHDISYIGADIVPALVALCQERFATASKRFVVLDATRDPLPASDLVLCRDLLIHLAFADALRLLANVRASGARWFLSTQCTAVQANAEILSGDFRPVNLCRPPFSLPEPEEVILEEGGLSPDRAMALWPAAALPRR